jgi:glycosyltransferase involved in cell wall biosynthesis
MKIAQCLEYPIDQHGGTEVLVRELIRGLSPRHEILLVSNDDSQRVKSSSVGKLIHEHISWNALGATRRDMRALATRLHDSNVDLAHFHFGGTFAWGSRFPDVAAPIHLARLGTPCVNTNHGVFGVFDGYIGAQRSLFTKLALLPAAWASRMQLIAKVCAEVAVSKNDYRSLQRRYWPLRGKFRQIYHSQLREPPPASLEPRARDIICIGSIGARKGQTYLAEAFCRLAPRYPDWKLVLIGRGGDARMVAQIEQLRKEHGLLERVLLLGNQSDEEVNRWFGSAAIFVMPSVAEGLGLSLQEALFHGCACLASRAGGIQDLIQHEDNGLLVEPRNVEELGAALERLISDEPLRHRLASRGPKSILEKGMTAERMVKCYKMLYQECLHDRVPVT